MPCSAPFDAVLDEHKPDWTLVYGDTNSTIAAALAAVKLHLRVAHLFGGTGEVEHLPVLPADMAQMIAQYLPLPNACQLERVPWRVEPVRTAAREGFLPG